MGPEGDIFGFDGKKSAKDDKNETFVHGRYRTKKIQALNFLEGASDEAYYTKEALSTIRKAGVPGFTGANMEKILSLYEEINLRLRREMVLMKRSIVEEE
jgi:hypothetical protein